MKKIDQRIKARMKVILGIMSVFLMITLFNSQTIRFWGANKKQIVGQLGGSFAFLGMVASMKKKNVWDSASAETKAMAEEYDASMQENFKSYIALTDLDAKLKEFADKAETKGLTKEELLDFKEMVKGYKDVAVEMQKMKDNGIATRSGVNPIKQLFDDNKAQIEKFRAKELKSLTLETKTADTGDIATHTIGYRVPGVGLLPVRQPFMMDLFPIVNVNLEFIKYMDQETVVRDAKNVAGITPMTSTTALTWKERNIQITKVKDFIDVNIDMLGDYDFVAGELYNLVTDSVILKADNGLLKDNGVYPDLHSTSEVASEFDASNTLSGTITPWAGTIESPDMFALVIAMSSQIIALGKEGSYMPDTVLWNTIDKYKSMLLKDKNGQYVLPPFVAVVNNKEYTIDAMKVRTNPNVGANTCQVFDSRKATLYMRKGIGVDIAYENKDNFQVEVATIKAYLRMNLLIRNVNKNAFMKCSDNEAAIAALAKPGI